MKSTFTCNCRTGDNQPKDIFEYVGWVDLKCKKVNRWLVGHICMCTVLTPLHQKCPQKCLWNRMGVFKTCNAGVYFRSYTPPTHKDTHTHIHTHTHTNTPLHQKFQQDHLRIPRIGVLQTFNATFWICFCRHTPYTRACTCVSACVRMCVGMRTHVHACVA